ncbi:uncharacterized protein [Temnothorax nylanderi]|uniref:uncharacterized protein n=1 Tax=Temnothorax nylanderi TaxID=102681 RepID=UPI003A87B4B0
MDKLNDLKSVCDLLQIQTAALTREVDDLCVAVQQLQLRLRNITEKVPSCLQLTVRVDEDAVMLERTAIITSLAKKSRNQIRLFVSKIHAMHRDVARLDATEEAARRQTDGDDDGDESNNQGPNNQQGRGVVTIDDEGVPDSWSSQK